MENNATIFKSLDAAHDYVFFKFKTGNAISEQSAHPVVTVVNMNVIASDA